MTDDLLVREATERLLPPESPTFFDDFWEQAAARDHLAARRWRRRSLALAAVALAAASAAGVIAAPSGTADVADASLTCETQTQGGYQVFDLGAGPARPASSSSWRKTASLILTTGGDSYYGTKLLVIDAASRGFLVNKSLCTSSGRDVELARRGLPFQREYRKGSFAGREFRCVRSGRIAFRYRLTTGANGEPVSARVVVEMAKTRRPMIYVEWSPAHVVMYAATSCTDSDF